MLASRLLVAGGSAGGFDTMIAYNDEFDAGTGSWVLLPGDGDDLPDIDSTVPGRLWMPPGTAVTRAGLPPMPFTMTAYMASVVALHSDLSEPGNCTFGLVEAGAWRQHYWGTEFPDIDIPTNTAHYDAHVTADNIWTHLGTKVELSGHVFDVPTYHQMLVHSATNMDLYFSYDNVTYTAYGTGFNPTMTPAGIIIASFGFTTEWEWVRFRAGASSGPA